MAYIWDRVEMKKVEVRNLKNLKISHIPNFEFFVHKAYKTDGYSVTERLTGSAVVVGKRTRIIAEEEAKAKLVEIDNNKMKEMVIKALKNTGRMYDEASI